jgi:hypothetical protein
MAKEIKMQQQYLMFMGKKYSVSDTFVREYMNVKDVLETKKEQLQEEIKKRQKIVQDSIFRVRTDKMIAEGRQTFKGLRDYRVLDYDKSLTKQERLQEEFKCRNKIRELAHQKAFEAEEQMKEDFTGKELIKTTKTSITINGVKFEDLDRNMIAAFKNEEKIRMAKEEASQEAKAKMISELKNQIFTSSSDYTRMKCRLENAVPSAVETEEDPRLMSMDYQIISNEHRLVEDDICKQYYSKLLSILGDKDAA